MFVNKIQSVCEQDSSNRSMNMDYFSVNPNGQIKFDQNKLLVLSLTPFAYSKDVLISKTR